MNYYSICFFSLKGTKIIYLFNIIKLFSEPKTTIIGNEELYIEAGSTINLTCTIQTGPSTETLIYWNYNGKVKYSGSLLQYLQFGVIQIIRNILGG